LQIYSIVSQIHWIPDFPVIQWWTQEVWENTNHILEEEKITLAQNIIASLVKLYYDTVDNKNFEEYKNLLQLFHPNCIYDRCELHLDWKEAITEFFKERFDNLDITHTTQEIIPFENKVIVIWSFNWKNKRLKKEIQWNFVDIHEFDIDALEYKNWEEDILFHTEDIINFFQEYWGIRKRRTYLEDSTIKSFFPTFEYSLIDLSELVEKNITYSHNRIIKEKKFYDTQWKKVWEIQIDKFTRMGYGFIIIDGEKGWEQIHEIHIVNLTQKNSPMRYFISNKWADIIK